MGASAMRAAGCSACRFTALRLFVTGFPALRVSFAPVSTSLFASTPITARYSSFQATSRLHNKSPAIEEQRTEQENDDGNELNTSTSEPGSTEKEEVPWYLQVEPPRHPTLMHEPPPLPDIPDGSPKLMEPLVKFASEELGLDDLSLLDLRELDPPAAIGPDLMMLFGTARSERHLHVSADRLVRFLRGRGISAKADGLLGRNELKVKLRRRARKEKLLGSTGGSRTFDDGITTGWICVNIGTVGRGSSKETIILDEAGSRTGFGVPELGTTVVVQMMTESKRQELDLEKLWTDMLRRGLEKIARPIKGSGGKAVQNSNAFLDSQAHSTGSRGHLNSSKSRFFSTSTRHTDTIVEPIPEQGKKTPSPEVSGRQGEEIPDEVARLRDLIEHDTGSRLHVLGMLKEQMVGQPGVLGRELRRGQDSPLVRLYNRAMDGLPPAQALPFRFWFEVTARVCGAAEYTVAKLRALFTDIQLAGTPLSPSEYADLVRAIYVTPAADDADVRERSYFAVEVVDCMFTRGEEVLNNELVVAVVQGLTIGSASKTPGGQRLLSQFEEFLFQGGLPCPSENQLLALLEAYANAGSWDKFWAVWRIGPQRYARRTARMYRYVFDRFARDGHQMRAMDAIRWCVNEMEHEVPPVTPVGPVKLALEACLRVADPDSEAIAKGVAPKSYKYAGREFPTIWSMITPKDSRP
ncbi:hypothetical protein B0H66DRAFT_227021 [Apodospora peruviana]|uniref:ATPase synthesis protein 25 n=1 Tax=Apodospora peruviana TaxID=516989 RepID=A0AAE0I3Y8_9PEZI|nr:hypothetical protein B0H66DRAFT_227021 [Apodospora peruviana]